MELWKNAGQAHSPRQVHSPRPAVPRDARVLLRAPLAKSCKANISPKRGNQLWALGRVPCHFRLDFRRKSRSEPFFSACALSELTQRVPVQGHLFLPSTRLLLVLLRPLLHASSRAANKKNMKQRAFLDTPSVALTSSITIALLRRYTRCLGQSKTREIRWVKSSAGQSHAKCLASDHLLNHHEIAFHFGRRRLLVLCLSLQQTHTHTQVTTTHPHTRPAHTHTPLPTQHTPTKEELQEQYVEPMTVKSRPDSTHPKGQPAPGILTASGGSSSSIKLYNAQPHT